MLAFVEGEIVEKEPTHVIVQAGGLGYEVFIPLSSYDRLPAPGGRCRLLLHDHVREDAHLLFGFATEAERRLFRMLIEISGIGPRLALGALSGLTPREFTAAVAEGDVKRLSRIRGIGRRTAERIVVELRSRLSEAEALEAKAGGEPLDDPGRRRRDTLLALIALGYARAEAQRMVQSLTAAQVAGESVEDLVRAALTGRG